MLGAGYVGFYHSIPILILSFGHRSYFFLTILAICQK